MKRIIPFFICLAALTSEAQTYNERSAILEIGYGVAVPFGKFEAATVSDSASGYATGGTNLNVMFTYMVGKKAGVSAMISSSVNRLSEGGEKGKFQAYADRFGGIVSDMHLAKWSTMGYMAGGYLTQPLQKASFNMQLLFGYSRTEYPETEVVIFKDTAVDAIDVTQSATDVASSFCFNVGAGIKYNISEIMCLCVNANFFSAYPAFEKVVTTSSDPYTDDEIHRVHQRVSLLNVTAGIGFRF